MFTYSRACCGLWLLVGLAGCQGGPPAPPTHPVTGKVAWKGGEPLAEGNIILTSVNDPNIVASGTIVKGEFSVSTLMDDRQVKGATAGEHMIQISLPQGADQAPQPRLRLSKNKCTVEAKENTLTIEIEKVRP
jgi:hypothetical protein